MSEATGRVAKLGLRARVIHKMAASAFAFRAITLLVVLQSFFAATTRAHREEVRLFVLLTGISIVLSAFSVMMAVGLAVGRFDRALTSPLFFAGDVGLMLALNLWAITLVGDHQMYLPGGSPTAGDLFTFPFYTVVALWTGVRGNCAGLALVLMGVAMFAIMGAINGFHLREVETGLFVSRCLWLLANYVVASFIVALVGEAVEVAAEQSLLAGRVQERVNVYRRMHDTALNGFLAIANLVAHDQDLDEQRVDRIRNTARQEAARLRQLCRQAEDNLPEEFDKLDEMTSHFELRTGISVDFNVIGELPPQQSGAINVLTASMGEALANVERHSGSERVTILVKGARDGIKAVVRDYGCGFDPDSLPEHALGIRNSLFRRIEEIGGTVIIDGSAAPGTRVEMWIPFVPEPPVGTSTYIHHLRRPLRFGK